jgi:hypothetical protein
MPALGHEPKVSLGENLACTASDGGHRFQPRRFLSRANGRHPEHRQPTEEALT